MIDTYSRVILLEFNELSPTLIQQFMQQGILPNFARLHRESYTYVTEAEETPPNLEPWIQWVTVHTGLSFRQHGVFVLGDGHNLDAPRVWDLVSNAGKRVLVLGSMNVAYHQPFNGIVLPDPWSTGIMPLPTEELQPYVRFVRSHVQEYTADSTSVSAFDTLRFIGFMATHGLSARTISAIICQLRDEHLGRGRWKRATILDRLQWDVFRYYYRKSEPAFATFFLNSTAHYQHVYWRDMDPTPFSVKPSEADQREYGGAVRYGYQGMDKIVGDCLAMAGPTTTVVLSTALSQQPCLTYESIGGKTFYKFCDPDNFFELVGIRSKYTYAPVMSEEFHLYMSSEEDARNAAERLAALQVGGELAFTVRSSGNEVFAGCRIFHTLSGDAMLTGLEGKAVPFFRYLYKADITKSGMHHPDGILWIRTPTRKHSVHEPKVPLLAVAPTLLHLLGLPKLKTMSGEILPEIVGETSLSAAPVTA
jgi:hypothetical protein